MILGLNHVAIAVADMQRALDFYGGVLGFEVVMEAALPGGVAALDRAMGLADARSEVRMLRKGNSCLELFEFTSGEPDDPARPVNRHGLTHIALASDEYLADYERLAANGVEFNAPPFGAAPQRFAYGRDPFGIVIELLEHDPQSAFARAYTD